MKFQQFIKNFLLQNQDIKNAEFQRKIVNTNYKIYGIKTLKLENFAKELIKKGATFDDFDLSSFEEILLAGMYISYCKLDVKKKLDLLKTWLDYVDNWACCDMIASRLRKQKDMISQVDFFQGLLSSKKTYHERFGIVFLMAKPLKNDVKKTLNMILNVQNEDYYIKMAKAWAIAEAALIDYEYVKEVIANIQDKFIRNMAISKCRDSFRLDKIQKEELKLLKLK